jgi:hypothetical protein
MGNRSTGCYSYPVVHNNTPSLQLKNRHWTLKIQGESEGNLWYKIMKTPMREKLLLEGW